MQAEPLILEQLGDGLTSQVNRCQIGEKTYALKVYKDTCSQKSRMKEILALTRLRDTGVIRLVSYDPHYSWILTELLYKKDLFDFIAFEKKCLDERIARYLFLKLGSVLSAIHSLGYVHRDIKLENILLDPVTLEPRLCDLGFAEKLSLLETSRSMGTSGYMAPELQLFTLEGQPVSEKIESKLLSSSDVFALGVCLFIVTFAHPPFQSTKKADNCAYWRCINAGRWDTFWKACERHKAPRSRELKNLLQAMLCPNPKLRPSVSMLLKHQWFRENVASQEEYYQEMLERRNSFENKQKN